MTPSPSPETLLRLGTRRSLLALAQSSWVARQLEALHPGLRVELVGIETRGDQLLDVPLSTAPGREFFVAELDAALLAGKVDFTVHSHKDLSLERPPELVLAATPRRANPRDVILFGPSAPTRLQRREPLRIGTGAPRRITNLAEFLPAALPGSEPQPLPAFIPIRGNVDTRLSRIHLPESEERHLDGVVLALAGLSRLWTSGDGQTRLKHLLTGASWMVLPLAECPTAPAQGALALECRAQDGPIRQRLAALDHPETAAHVDRERRILAEWGGGCHQALGATSFSLPGGGSLLHIRGRKPDGTPIAESRATTSETDPAISHAIPPGPNRVRILSRSPLPSDATPAPTSTVLFVRDARALPTPSALTAGRVWAADTATWHALARAGVWVEGSAEAQGLDALGPTLDEPILGLESVLLPDPA